MPSQVLLIQWTIHTAAECKRVKTTRGKKDYNKNKKAIKRQNFKDKQQAFIQAKAAYEACLGTDSDEEQDTIDSDNDKGSNGWHPATYQKEAMTLDIKGVRSGDGKKSLVLLIFRKIFSPIFCLFEIISVILFIWEKNHCQMVNIHLYVRNIH